MNVLYIVIQERLPYVEEGMLPWEAFGILWWGHLTRHLLPFMQMQ